MAGMDPAGTDLRGLLRLHAANVARVAAAFVLSPLPSAWRGGLVERHSLDVGAASIPSAVLQFFVGLLCGVLGFRLWMGRILAEIVAAAEAEASNEPLEKIMRSFALVQLNPLLPFIYVLTSPLGFASLLVFLGGGYRAIAQAVGGQPAADPTLDVVEWARRRWFARRAVRRREALKGPPAPDRILEGGESSRWHVRIVTRDDLDWPVGGGVFLDGVLHDVIARGEMTDENGRLRLHYDLVRHETAVAARTVRRYAPAVPPLRRPARE